MIRKYIIEADDSIKGFDEEIAKLEREWAAEEIEPCEDCISRESLRQKLQENRDFFVNAFGGFKNMNYIDKARVDEIDNCMAMVVNAPSVTPQQTRWIPVTERLPEKNEVVLITNKWHEVDKALYIGGESFDIIINYLQKEEVIAWMPLPESYKKEKEEEK